MKKFIALARVSSREQEREGFSLDVQEDALKSYATRHDGQITKLFRIAETASKRDERLTFKALLAYAKEHAAEFEGVLFYKVDRAARNLFDYVELERLELDYGLRVIYVAQPTENSPAGRMQRRILANMASFYTEQQSIDVKEGHQRRVKSGLFVGHAPYGYMNIRNKEGRSLVELDPAQSPRVKRAFELYAFHNHTLDSLIEALATEGCIYTDALPRFPRSKLHAILRDRAYIGEVLYQGQWYGGTHERLIDRETFDRVQALLGGKLYHSHELTYASEIIRCGHCGHPITGELKVKQTKKGPKEYVYYRCARYNTAGHPRVRVTEAELDSQVLALFDSIKIKDQEVHNWFLRLLRVRSMDTQKASAEQRQELQRQVATIVAQQGKLLNLRLVDEIDAGTFTPKNNELKDRLAQLKLQLDACDRGRDENTDLAVKAFELSQRLAEKWVTADCRVKRQILEIVCLNCTLENTSLVATIRKPFDVLREDLAGKKNRGDSRWTILNESYWWLRGAVSLKPQCLA
jgi:site-specific DNA recombinase